MRELRFDGLSPDGTRLILAGKDGQKYSVVIDERIEAAVRRDRARIGQVEIEQAGMLRPREIQARIRSGQTAEDVAAASGLPIEHIRRFEGPVLTERAWVAQQAQATEVRRPGGDIELGDLVAERLHAEGVDAADIAWDAWRRDDGTWVVIATFPLPPNTHVATWTYDSGSRTMTVVDDNAGTLSAIDPQAPLQLAPSRPMLATVAPIEDEDDSLDDEPAVLTSLPAWGHSRADADEAELTAEDEPESGEHPVDEEPELESVAPWDDSEELEDVADEVGLEEPTAEEIEDALDETAEVEATEAEASDEPDGRRGRRGGRRRRRDGGAGRVRSDGRCRGRPALPDARSPRATADGQAQRAELRRHPVRARAGQVGPPRSAQRTVPAAAPAARSGMRTSASVSPPCWPRSAGDDPVDALGGQRPVVARDGHDIPDPVGVPVVHRTQQVDDLGPGADVGAVTELLGPRPTHRIGATLDGVHVPDPRLAEDRDDVPTQRGPGLEVDAPIVGDVDDPVVGRHQERHVVGDEVQQPCHQGVHPGQLRPVGRRCHAVDVRRLVQVRPVDVGQARPVLRRARGRWPRRSLPGGPAACQRRGTRHPAGPLASAHWSGAQQAPRS